jgi:hypothetical protein
MIFLHHMYHAYRYLHTKVILILTYTLDLPLKFLFFGYLYKVWNAIVCSLY